MYDNSMQQTLGRAQEAGLAELGVGMAHTAAHAISRKYALKGSAYLSGESLAHLNGMDVSGSCLNKNAARGVSNQDYGY